MLKIIETPRDGIQGIESFIPTKQKIEYINSLLRVGFDTVEVGCFVSSKAIPQLKDTAEILRKIDLSASHSKVMVLVANIEGAKKAIQFDAVDYLLFPFSVSETFLKKNINKNLNEGFDELTKVLEVSLRAGKEPIAYLTMGFGNPYGDEWSLETLSYWVERLYDLGLRCIPLSDITGESTPETITNVFQYLIKNSPMWNLVFIYMPRQKIVCLKLMLPIKLDAAVLTRFWVDWADAR
jgi:hydroxymethylglutaryl-CoA lyase